MKLSEHTTSVLKNFATINQNLVIKEGNELLTMSSMKNIVAKATVDESFPRELAIYDLNEFLAVVTSFQNPVLDFHEQHLIIKEENEPHKKYTYFYSDPSVVQTPTKTITMPSEEVTLEISKKELSEIKRAASVIGSPDMVLEKSNGNSSLIAKDKNGDGEYKFYVKVENLKLLDGTYDVAISSKNISHFKNKNSKVEYWIALEPESNYTV